MPTPEELSFVDKLHNKSEVIGKSLNRSYRFIFGISALIILISTGIVEPTKDLSFEWINLKLKISVLLILLCSFLSISSINCYSLMIEHSELSDRIKAIYKSYKLNIKDLTDKDYDNIEYPDVLTMGLSNSLFTGHSSGKFFYSFCMGILLLCIILLPVASQILTSQSAIATYGYTWWIITIFVLMFLIDIVLIVAFIKKIFS